MDTLPIFFYDLAQGFLGWICTVQILRNLSQRQVRNFDDLGHDLSVRAARVSETRTKSPRLGNTERVLSSFFFSWRENTVIAINLAFNQTPVTGREQSWS